MNNSIFIFLCKGVPADAKLVYDITLKSFERAKEGWQLDGEQKLEQSRSETSAMQVNAIAKLRIHANSKNLPLT